MANQSNMRRAVAMLRSNEKPCEAPKFVGGEGMQRFLKEAGVPDEMFIRIDKIGG